MSIEYYVYKPGGLSPIVLCWARAKLHACIPAETRIINPQHIKAKKTCARIRRQNALLYI